MRVYLTLTIATYLVQGHTSIKFTVKFVQVWGKEKRIHIHQIKSFGEF